MECAAAGPALGATGAIMVGGGGVIMEKGLTLWSKTVINRPLQPGESIEIEMTIEGLTPEGAWLLMEALKDLKRTADDAGG